jgi:hypothetical protein
VPFKFNTNLFWFCDAAAVVKAIPPVPMPGAVVGMPELVAKKAKASKKSTPATLEESTVR